MEPVKPESPEEPLLIFSDPHGHEPVIHCLLDAALTLEVGHLLLLGDYGDPACLSPLRAYPGLITAVWGNCDRPSPSLEEAFARLGGILYPPPHTLHQGSKSLVMSHFPPPDLSSGQAPDYWLFGHLHQKIIQVRQRTWCLCPGDGCGRNGPPSAALLWPESGRFVHLDLPLPTRMPPYVILPVQPQPPRRFAADPNTP